jgi:hypothetical protein
MAGPVLEFWRDSQNQCAESHLLRSKEQIVVQSLKLLSTLWPPSPVEWVKTADAPPSLPKCVMLPNHNLFS